MKPIDNDFKLPISQENLRVMTWNPSSSKVPIVAFHGWLDNAMSFQPLALKWPHQEIRAVELPGHGLSFHKSRSAIYHFLDYVRVVHEYIVHQPTPVILMGHSLGAAVSSLAAGYLKDHLQELILIEGIGPLTQKDEEAGDQLGRFLSKYHDKDSNKQDIPKSRTIEDFIEARAKVGKISTDSARILMERNLTYCEKGQLNWNSDYRLKWPSLVRLTESQVLSILSKVTTPTLLIKAKSGILDDVAVSERLSAISATTVKREIEGGHHLHMEKPSEVAAIIKEYMIREE